MKKNANYVVNVSRQGLALCGSNVEGILKMPFTEAMVNDLDVVSLAELSGQVKSFVETNKIVVSELVIVLGSDMYFEKEMVGENVQDFVDSVPLVNPSSKIFKVEDKYRVVVINRQLYESLRTAFEALGFGVKAVVPELVLGSVGVVGPEFNLNSCRLILKSRDFILANSFIGPEVKAENDNWINHNKKKAMVLAVSGIVIAILGVIFIVWQTVSSRNTAVAKAKARLPKVVIVESTPVPSPVPVVASVSASLTDYSVQILNASGVSGEAGRTGEILKKIGFTNILLGNSGQSSKSIIIVSLRVPQEVRSKLTEVLGPMTIVENSQTQFDILITVGKIAP